MFSVPHTYAGFYKYCNKTISQVNVFPNAKAVLRSDRPGMVFRPGPGTGTGMAKSAGNGNLPGTGINRERE